MTGINTLFGGISVIFAGDFHQLLPCNGKPLYKSKCLETQSINRAIFLHKSHRFEDDPEYGRLLRRFCYGVATKEDKILLYGTRKKGSKHIKPTDAQTSSERNQN